MNRRRISLLALVSFLAAVLGGCPQPGTGSGTGGGTGGGGTLPPITLTTAQSQAIDAVAQQMTGFGGVLGTLSELANARLTLATLPQIDTFGACPSVSLVSNASSAAIAFNFADGCSGDQTAGKTVTGGLDIRITRSTGETTVTPLNLTVDGTAIGGTMRFTLSRSGTTVTLAGEITDAITLAGAGTITGTLTLEVSASGPITITTASLTFDDGSTSYAVTLANVVSDPAGNGNFVPESGTASFSVTESGTATPLVVTFKSTTPTDGGVDVTLNGTGSATETVPLP